MYTDKSREIEEFLLELSTKYSRVRVIFTGAGTSAYVGDTVTPYLKGKVDEKQWELLSIPTTLTSSTEALNHVVEMIGAHYTKVREAKIKGIFLEGPVSS